MLGSNGAGVLVGGVGTSGEKGGVDGVLIGTSGVVGVHAGGVVPMQGVGGVLYPPPGVFGSVPVDGAGGQPPPAGVFGSVPVDGEGG